MRANGLSLTLAAVAAAGLCMGGARLAAVAQGGQDSKKATTKAPPSADNAPEKAEGSDTKKLDAAETKKADNSDVFKKDTAETKDADAADNLPAGQDAKKPDTAEQQKLRADLNDLLKQRVDLDRRIAETRGNLGEKSGRRSRIELRTGDGPPRVFEFDGSGSLPPEARKRLEEAQKRMKDAFKNLPLDSFENFDFKFDGPNGFNEENKKAFRERMQKWQKQFHDRMQRRFNGDDALPGDKDKGDKSDKKTDTTKLKTLDA